MPTSGCAPNSKYLALEKVSADMRIYRVVSSGGVREPLYAILCYILYVMCDFLYSMAIPPLSY